MVLLTCPESYCLPPIIPYTIITIVSLPCVLKATIQKFRDLKDLQSPVKTVFHLSLVIPILTLAPSFIHQTSVARALMRQSFCLHHPSG